MNINDNYKTQSQKTPNQNTQYRPYGLDSLPAQDLTGKEQSFNNNHNNNIDNQKKAKKKCHGNQRAQHLRRRLRRREQKMNQNTTVYNEHNNLNEEQQQIQNASLNNRHNSKIINKRKRQNSNKDSQHISQSFSQLSISQRNTKRKKLSISRNNQSNNNELLNGINDDNTNQTNKKKKMTGDDYGESLSINYMQKFKPHYLKVSDKRFKQMLSNAAIQDGDKIIQALNTNENIQFVRQMTEVTNDFCYFRLQQQLWQEYYNMSLKEDTMKAPTGQQRQLSKFDAKQHNTCHKYNFPKHVIEKRQQRIANQIKRSTNKLNEYRIQLKTWTTTQCYPPIDSNILLKAINECVEKGQLRLRQEFDYKKKMLEFNSNDYYLINKVYELLPTDEQLRLAKMIWQATVDELKTKEKEEILRKRIFLQRLPVNIDITIDQSVDHVQSMLSNPVLDKDRRAGLISNYSKTVTQYKFDLMTLNLNTLQNIIRGYQQTLIDLKEKLLQCHCNQSLKQAIENRQEAIRKRHEIYLEHKLNTFFDEAPAMTVSNQ